MRKAVNELGAVSIPDIACLVTALNISYSSGIDDINARR